MKTETRTNGEGQDGSELEKVLLAQPLNPIAKLAFKRANPGKVKRGEASEFFDKCVEGENLTFTWVGSKSNPSAA